MGLVVDPSGRPVPGARIVCGSVSAETGPDGRFSLSTTERCEAAITADGFETKHTPLDPAAEARIELAIAPRSERVVVTATRRETTPEEAGVAATILTSQDLAARGTPALGSVLEDVPGMQVTRYGRPGSLTQLFGRGGQRTATLMVIDGVPVNDPGGELNLAGYSTSGLERIEVVRGPESALFGADAASGVVQMFTKRGSPEDRLPRGSVAYERGSFQTDRWAANLAGGSGQRFDYALAAEQFHTVGEYANDYFRNTSGTANLGYRISPSTEVRGVFRSFDSMTGTPNQVGWGIYNLDANESTRDTLASASLDDVRGPNFVQHVRFGYHRSWDLYLDPEGGSPDPVSALVRDAGSPVSRVYFERLANPSAPVPAGLRLVTAWPYTGPSDPYLSLSSRKNFEYQGTLAHAGGATVFGYDYERQDARIEGTPADRNNHSVFVHEQYSFARRAFLSGGLRVERNSAFGTKVTPRGAASFLVAGEHGALSSTYLRASAGLGIVEPSMLQNFAQNPYYVGNAGLRPEKTTSYEAGMVQEWFHRRVRAEVSAFDNAFKDLIVFVSLPYPEPGTWRNLERSRARGLEFSGEAKLTRLLSVSGGYTRLWSRIISSSTPDSIFTGVGQELPHRAGNSGSFSATFSARRWMFNAGAIFIGERQDPDTGVFGVTRNPGYQDFHASGSFRVSRHLVPYLRAGNLFNQYYEPVLGYPASSRNINGGVRVEW
ncbi:MAG TPA: TonB-dependent receptor [Bryobacteraceae bacterium]|nr:TonB-dependent receptor [Bryobacteraceae bacterium]